jgi:hypothetical protein
MIALAQHDGTLESEGQVFENSRCTTWQFLLRVSKFAVAQQGRSCGVCQSFLLRNMAVLVACVKVCCCATWQYLWHVPKFAVAQHASLRNMQVLMACGEACV